jgi:hypothetical protein
VRKKTQETYMAAIHVAIFSQVVHLQSVTDDEDDEDDEGDGQEGSQVETNIFSGSA